MSEFLGNIAVEIIGSLIDKAGTFVAGQAGNRIDWKVWKNKYKFTDNESDFLDRYAEAIVALGEAGKPKELLQFYGRENVIRIIHDYWYGELDEGSFEIQFGQLTRWFTLEKRLVDFTPAQEEFFFLTHYKKAVNLNRTAGETEIYQLLLEILKETKKGKNHSNDQLYNHIFLFCNDTDRPWINAELLPKFEEAKLQVHFIERELLASEGEILKDTILKCRKTLVLRTPNFSEVQKHLLRSLDLLPYAEPIKSKLISLDIPNYSVGAQSVGRFISELSTTSNLPPPKATYPPLDEQFVNITYLPYGGKRPDLYDRQRELDLLDQAWGDDNCHVLCFTADGGVGKSLLVAEWLNALKNDNFRGAGRVLATSFFSQGTGEKVTSADSFIQKALEWFGDTDTTLTSPWEKGKRLARLVNEHRTLLILDGLEPLQEGGVGDKGKTTDPALFVLVRELAKKNQGLCVVTSRVPLAGMPRQEQFIRIEHLDQISTEAAKTILRSAGKYGVQGSDEALETTIASFGNHALAINLLATWLATQPGQPIEAAANIPDLEVPEEKGRHPRRVIAAFERWLLDNGKPEAARLLRLLGLFDRPVTREVIAVADPSLNLPDALATLRRHRLVYEESRHDPAEVDCHPLVREHFEEVFQKEQPEQWKAAHGALYEYYKGLPEKLYGKYLPDTLEEMEPLFLAVRHGCGAGMYFEIGNETYWMRIRRMNENFLTLKLGGYSYEFALLSYFFKDNWTVISDVMPDKLKALIISWTAYAFRAIGQLSKAFELEVVSLQIFISICDWKSASIEISNLNQTNVSIGNLSLAVEYGLRGIVLVNRSYDIFQLVINRITLANALFQRGEIEDAHFLFKEAEKIQATSQPDYPNLYSKGGFYYGVFLLHLNRVEEVLNRGITNLKLESEGWCNLLDFGLNRLIIGISYSNEYLSKNEAIQSGIVNLDEAINQLRKAGNQEYIPLALLARAAYHRHTQNWQAAEEDLEEVLDIAEPSGMRLHLTDYHLEMARLLLAQERPADARPHVAEAARLIGETGYHRRDKELEELQKAIT
ncbi:MAG: tetratricopeptide repeat protein [Saprospiraceae bacterium]|nr:tetratricopeptide repeat protein [Saprospiraceae bacterium]